MLAFVAAVAAELSTGKSVLQQLASAPAGVAVAVLALALGTLAPLLSDVEAIPPFAFFSKRNETLVGRVAMLGFVGLVLVEQLKGSALF